MSSMKEAIAKVLGSPKRLSQAQQVQAIIDSARLARASRQPQPVSVRKATRPRPVTICPPAAPEKLKAPYLELPVPKSLPAFEGPAMGRLVQTNKATPTKEVTCADCGLSYDPDHPEHRPHGRYDQCGRCGRLEDSESGVVRLEGEQVWAHKSVSFCVIKGRKEIDPEELARARRR